MEISVSRSTTRAIGQNEKVLLKGSIKEHSEYNDVKQTIITRCKIISLLTN